MTNYTTYLAITGELWGVFCEDSVENWPRYNGTTLDIEADLGAVNIAGL